MDTRCGPRGLRVSVLAGGRIVTPSTVLEPGWVEIRDGVVVDVGAGSPPSAPTTDLGGAWLVPGFVDVHVHGGGAHDMARSAEDMAAAVQFHRAHGTTSTLVSLVTAPPTQLGCQLRWVSELAVGQRHVLGAHLEGPFLSTVRCGAQNPEHLQQPDLAMFGRLHAASEGTLRMITVAPELPGSLELIRAAREANVTVAVGHSDATYAEAMAAVGAGATAATHLFNGMRPMHHREPGVANAALDADLYCEVINDGHHVHAALVRLVAAARPDRLVLVTDAIDATGMPDGPTMLGGQAVDIDGGVARLRRTGALAGSTLTMDEALRRSIVEVGLDVVTAVRAASTNAARMLGLDGRIGSISPGRIADLVVLDEDFCVQSVLTAGEGERSGSAPALAVFD